MYLTLANKKTENESEGSRLSWALLPNLVMRLPVMFGSKLKKCTD